MTKQEKIREGIARTSYHFDNRGKGCFIKWEVLASEHKIPYYEFADIVLYKQDSQGVVIRVKCPYCEWSQFGEEAVGMTPCYSCNSTGYIIKPLIVEE